MKYEDVEIGKTYRRKPSLNQAEECWFTVRDKMHMCIHGTAEFSDGRTVIAAMVSPSFLEELTLEESGRLVRHRMRSAIVWPACMSSASAKDFSTGRRASPPKDVAEACKPLPIPNAVATTEDESPWAEATPEQIREDLNNMMDMVRHPMRDLIPSYGVGLDLLRGAPPSGLRSDKPPEPVRKDALSFGGWSAGDVMAYLERFGEAQNAVHPDQWSVRRGLFHCRVWYVHNDERWALSVKGAGAFFDNSLFDNSLPELMRRAVERWRELVAESDPLAEEREFDGDAYEETFQGHGAVVHIGTGDMGTRSTYGGGWSLLGEEGDGELH